MFSIDGVYDIACKYVDSCLKSVFLNDIVNGDMATIKLSYQGKRIFPLLIYYDDFECGNPLGSHAGKNKIGAFYFSLRCFPKQFQSRIDNIFLAMLAYSSDMRTFDNEIIFNTMINDLNYLQTEGINVKSGNESFKIYFQLLSLVGDNLAMNTIGGFVQSFNAKYYCRLCKASKDIMHRQITEDVSLIRKRNEYERDLILNRPSETGIRSECIFNKVSNFHILDNVIGDIMHDITEGVCNFDLSKIILFYVERNLFSLETLNNKIRFFNYGENEATLPDIKLENLVKESLGFSSSEMISFMNIFPYLIGSYVPCGDKHWQLYLILRQILDILFIVVLFLMVLRINRITFYFLLLKMICRYFVK